MKKLSIIITSMCLVLLALVLTPQAHAYTLSNVDAYYYNYSQNIGYGDSYTLTTEAGIFITEVGFNWTNANDTIRLVFTNAIPSQLLPSYNKDIYIEMWFFDSSLNTLGYNKQKLSADTSLSYFESNFIPEATANTLDSIEIMITELPIGYDEDLMNEILHGALIAYGNGMIINQTILTTQYQSGWTDAMNSKVTQIWSIWGNIFDTFMSIFDIFSIQLIGDITIGHIALVPLVLGLIGFIYALGGKRGR